MANKITIYDVVLRDGIQKKAAFIPSEQKQQILHALYAAGLRNIEVASFVNPSIMPQMADAEMLVTSAQQLSNLQAQALVMNQHGFERAIAAGAKAIGLVASCSETFSQKNSRVSVESCNNTVLSILKAAKPQGIWCRVYMTTAWVCPYEGIINSKLVTTEIEKLLSANPDQIALADTIGYATPSQVRSLLHDLSSIVTRANTAVHFHDTKAYGLANVLAALDAGICHFDGALGGVGGCPFAPGAAGNLATEDLVLFLEDMGLSTGISLEKLWQGVNIAEQILGGPLGGRTRAFYESRKK